MTDISRRTIVEYCDDNGRLHRDGRPARLIQCEGTIVREEWYHHGRLYRPHLDSQPVVSFFNADGAPTGRLFLWVQSDDRDWPSDDKKDVSPVFVWNITSEETHPRRETDRPSAVEHISRWSEPNLTLERIRIRSHDTYGLTLREDLWSFFEYLEHDDLQDEVLAYILQAGDQHPREDWLDWGS